MFGVPFMETPKNSNQHLTNWDENVSTWLRHRGQIWIQTQMRSFYPPPSTQVLVRPKAIGEGEV